MSLSAENTDPPLVPDEYWQDPRQGCAHRCSRPWGRMGFRECLDCGHIWDTDPEDEPGWGDEAERKMEAQETARQQIEDGFSAYSRFTE